MGGYGGSTDSAAMIGDEGVPRTKQSDQEKHDRADARCHAGGEEDAEEGLRWLDELLRKYPKIQKRRAVDAGAGVGRITRLVLTKLAPFLNPALYIHPQPRKPKMLILKNRPWNLNSQL